MSSNDIQRDTVLAALRELRTYDVSPARARRLRTRCLRRFEMRETARDRRRPAVRNWMRVAGALASAWCVVYLLETIRRAAAVFGF